MSPALSPNKQILDSSIARLDNTLMEFSDSFRAMRADPVWESEKGTFMRVVVKPNSKVKKLVSEITEEAIFLNLSAPARDGKANGELIKRLAKAISISTGAIEIVSGQKDRKKVLLVRGVTRDIVHQKLSDMI